MTRGAKREHQCAQGKQCRIHGREVGHGDDADRAGEQGRVGPRQAVQIGDQYVSYDYTSNPPAMILVDAIEDAAQYYFGAVNAARRASVLFKRTATLQDVPAEKQIQKKPRKGKR